MSENIEQSDQVDIEGRNIEEVFREVLHDVGMWRNAACLQGITCEIRPGQTEAFELLNNEPPFQVGIRPEATEADIERGLHILVTQVNVGDTRSAIGRFFALRREKVRVKDYMRHLKSFGIRDPEVRSKIDSILVIIDEVQ